MKIEQLLHRRGDLSTFLVHLTRAGGGKSAKEQLTEIVTNGTIEARSAYGPATRPLTTAGRPTTSQLVVCFTETPLQYVSLLTEQIDSRQFCFEPYGVAVTRKQGRRKGVNPVWYLDITPGHDWLTGPLDALIKNAIADPTNAEAQEVFALTPFVEQMGRGTSATGAPYRKEFWWEREWRHVGGFALPHPNYLILCPEADFPDMSAIFANAKIKVPPMIDPSWSLEQIIGGLAGFTLADLGPM